MTQIEKLRFLVLDFNFLIACFLVLVLSFALVYLISIYMPKNRLDLFPLMAVDNK